ncbi:MAG TPA: hypothetical protein VJA21_11765 [Verrucomicrobiae bacterium]
MKHHIAAAVVLGMLSTPQVIFGGEPAGLRFSPGENNEFSFDTGLLRGKLRAGGRSAGLSSVVHVPTGTRLDASMGLLGHYRVFSANKRYGTAAWDWPSEARLAADGSVEVCWPAAADRPFELRARYRWAEPEAVDLETVVEAKANLLKFESFVASYFTSGFTNSAAHAGGQGTFLAAEKGEGVWQAFPRDAGAVTVIQDGRWKIEPNPVDWVIRPMLARPLGFRRCEANGLTAALMSPPTDCFAILTPHQAEGHYSMYLCLFGRDVKAGETARARARLFIAVSPPENALRQAYSAYLRGLSRTPSGG